jgi:FMN-dependent NADH-azoreductase
MLGHSSSLAQLSRYLRQILGFIGIEDVQTVRAEGMNMPSLAVHAVPNGEKAIEALVI